MFVVYPHNTTRLIVTRGRPKLLETTILLAICKFPNFFLFVFVSASVGQSGRTCLYTCGCVCPCVSLSLGPRICVCGGGGGGVRACVRGLCACVCCQRC